MSRRWRTPRLTRRSRLRRWRKAAGRTLGDVISVEESSYGGATLVRQQAEDGSFTDATLSAPGDLSVTAEVRVIYELK